MSDRTSRVSIDRHVIVENASVSLHGDVYQLEDSEALDRPAVILIYGGSWRSGDPSQQRIYGLKLAQAGYVCLAAQYRTSTESIWPAQLLDIQAALDFLRTHARELRVDTRRIGVSGNSSGGHLALMTACEAMPNGAAWTNSDGEMGVAAVCAFYAPTQLAGLDEATQDDAVAALMGSNADRDDYRRASPLSYADRHWPPTLLLSGTDDTRVPTSHTQRLFDALRGSGNTAELHLFAGQEHAFDMDRSLAQVSAAIMIGFFERYL